MLTKEQIKELESRAVGIDEQRAISVTISISLAMLKWIDGFVELSKEFNSRSELIKHLIAKFRGELLDEL